MSSSKSNMQPKKLLDNHEEAFKKIFGRFMFNIEHIEKNYCNTNSGLVYDPKTDKVTFDKVATKGIHDDKEVRTECRKIEKCLLEHTFGSALLSTPAPDPNEKSDKQITRWKKMNKLFDKFAVEKLNISVNRENEAKDRPQEYLPKDNQAEDYDILSLLPYNGSQEPIKKATGINSHALIPYDGDRFKVSLNKKKFEEKPKFISFYDHSEMGSIAHGSLAQNSTQFSQQLSTQQTYKLNVGDSEFQILKRHTIIRDFDKPNQQEKEVQQIFSSPDIVSAWVSNARKRNSTGNIDLRELNQEDEKYTERLNQSITYGETPVRACRLKRPLAITYENDEESQKLAKRNRRSL